MIVTVKAATTTGPTVTQRASGQTELEVATTIANAMGSWLPYLGEMEIKVSFGHDNSGELVYAELSKMKLAAYQAIQATA